MGGRGTMHFTDEQRELYEAEVARLRLEHGECGGGRHSMEGALTMHCTACCPPPPLSPEQAEYVGRLLSTLRNR